MVWMHGPGQRPLSCPTDYPSEKTLYTYQQLLKTAPLSLKDFYRDRSDRLWRALDNEVAAGVLFTKDVERLRRDVDGIYTNPLALRYLEADNATAIIAWMRRHGAFHEYYWVDVSVTGGPGRGTLALFALLQSHGAVDVGGDLAAAHLWHRLVGASHHWGLRRELRHWYLPDRFARTRQLTLEHRVQSAKPSRMELLFDWMDHIATALRPFIEAGSKDAIARLELVRREVAESRARYMNDLGV